MNLCTTLRVSGTGTTAFCDSTLEGKYVRVVNRKGSVNICDIQLKGRLNYLHQSPYIFVSQKRLGSATGSDKR